MRVSNASWDKSHRAPTIFTIVLLCILQRIWRCRLPDVWESGALTILVIPSRDCPHLVNTELLRDKKCQIMRLAKIGLRNLTASRHFTTKVFLKKMGLFCRHCEQGRSHGLKVGESQKKKFFVRGRAKSGRGRRSKLLRQNFVSSYPIIILIVVSKKNALVLEAIQIF